jgi:hypothetical protein
LASLKRRRVAAYFRGEAVDLWRDGIQARSKDAGDDVAEVDFA